MMNPVLGTLMGEKLLPRVKCHRQLDKTFAHSFWGSPSSKVLRHNHSSASREATSTCISSASPSLSVTHTCFFHEGCVWQQPPTKTYRERHGGEGIFPNFHQHLEKPR